MYDYITEELQAFDKMPELQEEDENHKEVMTISSDGAASSTG